MSRKVIAFSGHMIDRPERTEPRFPPEKELRVRDQIARQLEHWHVGAGDLGVCSGARGGDILFAECCLERGADVRLLLAWPEAQFIEASVRLPNSTWEERFRALLDHPRVTKSVLPDSASPDSASDSVFARTNVWIIETARSAAGSDPWFGLLVWDEKPTGDGPGGTSDFVARIRRGGGLIAPVINPTQLY